MVASSRNLSLHDSKPIYLPLSERQQAKLAALSRALRPFRRAPKADLGTPSQVKISISVGPSLPMRLHARSRLRLKEKYSSHMRKGSVASLIRESEPQRAV